MKGSTFVSTYDDSIDGIQMDGLEASRVPQLPRSSFPFVGKPNPLEVEIFNASWKRVVRLYFTLRYARTLQDYRAATGITGPVGVITRAPII